jgi:hypothetical protein
MQLTNLANDTRTVQDENDTLILTPPIVVGRSLAIKLVLFVHISLHIAARAKAADRRGAVDNKEHAGIGTKREVLRHSSRNMQATARDDDWGILGVHPESASV